MIIEAPEIYLQNIRPIRAVEIIFDSILNEGDYYTFSLGEYSFSIDKNIFSDKQRSLFDSLSEFPIGVKNGKGS